MRAVLVGLPGVLAVGLSLGALEAALVLSTDRALFLSSMEFLRYAVLALSASAALVSAIGALLALVGASFGHGRRVPRERVARRVYWAVLAAAAPAFAAVFHLLTEGRRVRDLPGRPVAVFALALALAWAAAALCRLLYGLASAGKERPAIAVFGALSIVALAGDMYILRRLYPVYHVALFATSLVAAAGAGLCLPAATDNSARAGAKARWRRGARPLAALCLVAAPWLLRALSDAPNVRFAVEQAAPISGKLLALWPRASRAAAVDDHDVPGDDRAAADARLRTRGLDLSGQDVLLLTVDALRADCLHAYGGDRGLTPALDALAARSVVFRRAYTPTPHTSYALASLMTGKFIRPVLELSNEPGTHPTLPRMLRHHGYRTAAFFPPAIFYVDAERFDWLRKDDLGFEYVKRMYASAEQRVAQLESYLQQAPAELPVFVWIHFFEPHEPYEPPPGLARGDSPRERYDGEVRAVDHAVGRILEVFRRVRGAGHTVVVTADHGEEFGDHGGHYHGTTLFDEQVRVPLLWSSPGASPRAVDTPAEILDITTTLLSGLGIPRDARMRGDDHGALLAGHDPPGHSYAFASIGDARMATDARHKVLCEADAPCSLYDLVSDPEERRDISAQHPEIVARLRGALSRFFGSIADVEALALGTAGAEGATGWPPALARARLGDPAARDELLPLLGWPRAEVRAAAARTVGELGVVAALNVLSRLRSTDEAPAVRIEAALAALRLGDRAALGMVREGLSRPNAEPDLKRRIALALAETGDASGAALLVASALDTSAEEGERVDALAALGQLGSKVAAAPLLALLDEVRLRPHVASALGRIGGKAAVAALRQALATERYPESRAAEARALLALGQQRLALPLIWRQLGADGGLAGGVGMLLESGELARESGAGADLLRHANVRRGPWHCQEQGCGPGEGATVRLPLRGAPRGPVRVIVRAHTNAATRALTVAGQRRWLYAGTSEVAFDLEGGLPRDLPIGAGDGVLVRALVVVARD